MSRTTGPYSSSRTRALVPLLAGLALLLGLALAPGAAAKSARYANVDVRLDLQPDGTLHVTETQTVAFDGGPFSYGFRDLPTARTEGITNIRVGELVDGKLVPFTRVPHGDVESGEAQYGFRGASDRVDVGWSFSPAYSESRTFVVEYDVAGVLRVYPNGDPPNQQIWWTAIGAALTRDTPVDGATVTLTLPRQVPLDQVVVQTNDADKTDDPRDHSSDGKTFTWTHGAFGNGEELIVRLQFPPVVENATAPSWQAADDAQRARAERSASEDAAVHLMLLGIAGLLLAGGGVTAYGAWYLRGRDPHTGLVAEFLPQPPDDLGPGVAGALLDERADDQDIVATFLDLARRGVITMTDAGTVGPTKRATGSDYLLELTREASDLAPHEARMVKALFGASPRAGDKARLSEVSGRVIADYARFREDLYAELVRHGYFTRSPEQTRRSWSRAGVVAAILGALVGVVGAAVFDRWVLIPGGAAIAVGLVYWRLGGSMPQKTADGAEAAAKWRAFRTYLQGIERFEKLDESKAIYDRYLPFAVAFGIDQSWTRKFATVATPAPSWFDPGDVIITGQPWGTGGGHRHYGGGTWVGPSSGGGGGGGIDLPDIDLPDLNDASKSAQRGIQGVSSGGIDLLKVAGVLLEIAAAFAGGGGKGGSSGGGGGGFR